jgi:hypothetical protein
MAVEWVDYRERGGPTDGSIWQRLRAAFKHGPQGPALEVLSEREHLDLIGDLDLYFGAFDPDEQDRKSANTLRRRIRKATSR